jgi:hypothetical protein
MGPFVFLHLGVDVMGTDNFGDWRIQAVTTLAQDVSPAYPGGPSHKAGTPVYLSSIVIHPQHNMLGFITPSATSLALSASLKSASAAQSLRAVLVLKKTVTPWGEGRSVSNENLPHFYDFLEHCMITVITAYQSLEMFCNDVISREVKSTYVLARKRDDLVLSADELERVASTDEKVGDIVPKLLSVASPKGRAIWERYLDLKLARDSTVHFKSRDAYTRQELDRESLFFQFFRRDAKEFPKIAFELIECFYAGKDLPRWAERVREMIAS